ncbi:MAG: C25 family cysteine peptidase, partial [Kiritimatiellae bacterium]|nr:C25 family cysteine peptidase [Kiritimatiellia bacterium]MDW8459396.1 C25 family cysteine peptidase [Verrucomicrobiota bacterium]
GNTRRMALEGLLRVEDMSALSNSDRAPVVEAYGCLMGNFSVPGSGSLGERLVAGSVGAVAVVGASSMAHNEGSVKVGSSLLREMYEEGHGRLGDAWAAMKGREASNRYAQSYQLLGDPALALGDAAAGRGGPETSPVRPSYEEWAAWAFSPAWRELGLPTEGWLDADRDRQSNYEEYMAGTDPMDDGSAFVVVTVRRTAEGRTEVRWESAGGRVYAIERATSPGGPYQTVADNLPATPGVNTWVDPEESTSTAFYRVRVK